MSRWSGSNRDLDNKKTERQKMKDQAENYEAQARYKRAAALDFETRANEIRELLGER